MSLQLKIRNIKTFEQKDLEFLEFGHKDLMVYLDSLLPVAKKYEELEAENSDLQYMLNNSKFVWLYSSNDILFAIEDDQYIGYCAFKKTMFKKHDLANVIVEELYVKPEHRCKGLGKKLLNELKKLNVKKLIVNVMQENIKALKFYKNYGFEENLNISGMVNLSLTV